MRLSAFQARKVGRWARQSRRLWICISSTWSVLSSASDRVICSVPLSRPDVHTSVAPASPSRAERVKVMSCQGDLEGLSGAPDIGGTPIQGHARRLGKSRDCEGLGGIAVLSRFQRMADVAGLLPRPVFDTQ